MDLSVFFQALPRTLRPPGIPYSIGERIDTFIESFPDWQSADLILLGCREHRGAGNSEKMGRAPNALRRQLYKLSHPWEKVRIADLGNLKPKDSPEGMYEALAYVLNYLISHQKTVVILGGSQDITFGQFLAYETLEKDIEYVHVDARFDMGNSELSMHNGSYNHRISIYRPPYLFNYTNLGYQSYFVSTEEQNLLKTLNFFSIRYGDLQGQIQEAEPYLRTADMLSFDFSAIRATDFPASRSPSPGGFSTVEACQIARYAGLATELSSFSLCEFNPQYDHRSQSALLGALMVWYFAEGFSGRVIENPYENRSQMRQYSVQLHASIERINFYYQTRSGRWWMEVPFQEEINKPDGKSLLVACSEKDYETAKADHIPERWWLTYNKLC